MKKVMDLLMKRLEEGKTSAVLSITHNIGSAPRTEGAVMLVGEEGRLAGTIGGGMLEYRCIGLAMEDIKVGKGSLRQYRLTKEAVADLGMVCGGDVDVLFSVLSPTEENMTEVKKIQHCLDHHEKGWILLPMDGSGIVFSESKSEKSESGNDYYGHAIENTSKVYVFGGGHLSQEVVPLLSHLGFRCMVTDDREAFSTKERFPTAEAVYTCQYTDLADKFDIHEADYIIAVTRGHIGDMDVQKFALKTPAHYIGVVGSKSKIAAVNERLRAEGFTEADLARITTPIGIDIHSETPAEIAVSIAAQLIEDRALYRKSKRA